MDLPRMAPCVLFNRRSAPMYFSVGDVHQVPRESFGQWHVKTSRRRQDTVGKSADRTDRTQKRPRRVHCCKLLLKPWNSSPNKLEAATKYKKALLSETLLARYFTNHGEDGTQGHVYKERTGSKMCLMFLVTKSFNLQPNISGMPGQCKRQQKLILLAHSRPRFHAFCLNL